MGRLADRDTQCNCGPVRKRGSGLRYASAFYTDDPRPKARPRGRIEELSDISGGIVILGGPGISRGWTRLDPGEAESVCAAQKEAAQFFVGTLGRVLVPNPCRSVFIGGHWWLIELGRPG